MTQSPRFPRCGLNFPADSAAMMNRAQPLTGAGVRATDWIRLITLAPPGCHADHADHGGGPVGSLGVCRTWGVDSEKRPQRGQFLPDLQAHSPAMGQKAGEKWTAEAVSQPTIPKPDRLLEAMAHHPGLE